MLFTSCAIYQHQLSKPKAEQLQCDEFHTLEYESRERMKELQEQYLQRADEISAELTEKHNAEMVRLAGEKLDQEKYYLDEIVKMRDEIDELEKMNKSLLSKNQDLDHADDQLPIVLSKVKHYEEEIKRNKEENKRLQEELDDKMGQLRDLLIFKTNHETLNHDLQEARQKNSEFQYRIIRLEKEIKEVAKEKDEGDLVEQLKIKLEKLLKERELKTDEVNTQSDFVQNLRAEIEQLKIALVTAQKEKESIAMQHHKILSELQQLKKQFLKSNSKSTFKDFVSLKREIKNLKYENDDLKEHIMATSNVYTSLPSIKHDKVDKSNKTSKPSSAAISIPKKSLQSISYH
ncbi:kinectin isoform X2 [Patella vulgata]|uniref:kinectin isoform X2 n=1 Tax=Patella vulgata TaxID=6465 RepID=UPI00218055BE|nr:kinectin isoform X2 [Patella vulgata]XP_050395615.1 kinectin isoform X2 [Patella vulgata]XP_050395616.1 kinectin isoform X2 [Patella vulgata]